VQSRAEILFSHRGHCRRRTTPHAIRHTHCGAAGPPRAQRRAAVLLFCPGAIPAGCLPACLLPACVPPCLPVRLPARSCLSPPEGHIQKLSSSVLVRGTWHHSRSIAILPVCLSDCHCVCFQYFHAVSQHAATADRLFCTRIIVQATATDTHTTPCAEEPSFLLLLFVLLFIFSSAVLTPIINPTEAPTPGQAYPTRVCSTALRAKQSGPTAGATASEDPSATQFCSKPAA
jgi:hypothetical protein